MPKKRQSKVTSVLPGSSSRIDAVISGSCRVAFLSRAQSSCSVGWNLLWAQITSASSSSRFRWSSDLPSSTPLPRPSTFDPLDTFGQHLPSCLVVIRPHTVG